jgi:hypothetical protein
MLVTRQNRIPFSWVVMAMLPWAFWYFQMTMGMVSFFLLNRLVENPAALTFWTSLPGLIFTFLPLGAFISFTSDRIWTRFGRRKPFIIAGFMGWAVVLTLYPVAGSAYVFIALMFLFALVGQFNAPLEALKLETIPPPMRGRSAALWSWITTILNITFWAIVIGRMDEVVAFDAGHLSGDKILYWAAAAGLLIAVFIYCFGIKEADPKSTLTGEKFSFSKLLKALTMKELRYLYLLLFATSMLTAGLGNLGMLMYTEQWSYSNQEMGFNIAVGGIINLFIIPLIGVFADKGNRMRIYLGCLACILVLKAAYFGYVTWYLPDQRPTLVEIIFFGELTCIFGIIAGVVYFPLVYDYIPRNLMGTYFSGAIILNGVIGFLTLNGAGVFLLWWANLFQPPAGEMVRVCLDRETDRGSIERTLAASGLKTPDGQPARSEDIVARAWYADGIVSETGTAFEIRLRDDHAKRRFDERKELQSEIGSADAKLKHARSQGAAPADLAARETALAGMRADVQRIDDELKNRSEAWRAEVLRGLGNEVFDDGAGLLKAQEAQAATALLPLLRKPTDVELERLNRAVRLADAQVVGLRVQQRERNFVMSFGAMLPAGGEATLVAAATARRVAELSATIVPGLIAVDAVLFEVTVKPVAVLEMQLVEVPVRSFVSFITRGVNAVLSVFTEVPPPDQKLHSLARSLTLDSTSGIALARVDALPAEGKGIRVTVVAQDTTLSDAKAWHNQVRDLAGRKGGDVNLTVPVPVLKQDVVPIKYNYLAGYLWMMALTIVGFAMILYFMRAERQGKVRKLGAEEAHAETQAKAASDAAADPAVAAPAHTTYTPGFLLPKLALAALGVCLLAFALRMAASDLRLLWSGKSAQAAVSSVIATKDGQAEERFTTHADLKTKTENVGNAKDYAWVFWNEFTFTTEDGVETTFRRDVGCKLKPSMPLLDEGGLPNTVMVRYDPANPQQTCLPYEYSTWFAPFIVSLLGLGAFAVGLTLAWFARRPIILDDVAAVNPQSDTTRIQAPGGKH